MSLKPAKSTVVFLLKEKDLAGVFKPAGSKGIPVNSLSLRGCKGSG
jgi:hypothetical protein